MNEQESRPKLDLGSLKPAPGSFKPDKREGRGRAGYGGKTCGAGHNGQKARAGKGVRPQFEGGQTPLYRRLPKKQYISVPNRRVLSIVNLERIALVDLSGIEEINPRVLLELGLIRKLAKDGVKLLGRAPLGKAIKFRVHSCSDSAKQAVEIDGGQVQIIELK